MTTGRLRRCVLPVALLGAVLLGAGGASAPANAQYPYYGAYIILYYYPYPYYYPYAPAYYAAPVAAAVAFSAGPWGWGWGRPWGWGPGWRGGWGYAGWHGGWRRLARRLGPRGGWGHGGWGSWRLAAGGWAAVGDGAAIADRRRIDPDAREI